MTGIPAPAAFLLGGLIGAVGHGPVSRWVRALRGSSQASELQRPGANREHSQLMAIFVTMHPAPWALGFGVPFLLYQLIFGPLPMMWAWLSLGMVSGAALAWASAGLAARFRQSG